MPLLRRITDFYLGSTGLFKVSVSKTHSIGVRIHCILCLYWHQVLNCWNKQFLEAFAGSDGL